MSPHLQYSFTSVQSHTPKRGLDLSDAVLYEEHGSKRMVVYLVMVALPRVQCHRLHMEPHHGQLGHPGPPHTLVPGMQKTTHSSSLDHAICPNQSCTLTKPGKAEAESSSSSREGPSVMIVRFSGAPAGGREGHKPLLREVHRVAGVRPQVGPMEFQHQPRPMLAWQQPLP